MRSRFLTKVVVDSVDTQQDKKIEQLLNRCTPAELQKNAAYWGVGLLLTRAPSSEEPPPSSISHAGNCRQEYFTVLCRCGTRSGLVLDPAQIVTSPAARRGGAEKVKQ